jgi:hypothetical protein
MMEGALVAIFALLATMLFARRARRNAHLLHHYDRCMSSFIEDAETLVNADETPSGVVDVVEFIAMKAAERSAAREFLRILVRHRRELASGPTDQTTRMIAEFKAKNPQLGRVFSHAMANGLMAMTYNGGPVGTFVRHLVLFDAKQHEDRSQIWQRVFVRLNAKPPSSFQSAICRCQHPVKSTDLPRFKASAVTRLT